MSRQPKCVYCGKRQQFWTFLGMSEGSIINGHPIKTPMCSDCFNEGAYIDRTGQAT